jgi:hypothetical protein
MSSHITKTVRIAATTAAVVFGLGLSAAPSFAEPQDAKSKHEHMHDHGSMGMDHMSEQGAANTNSTNAPDKDKGQERASERMSESGAAHSNADHAMHGAKHNHKDASHGHE